MTFQGELSAEEVDLVISVGLNWLMKEGALPMIVQADTDVASLQAPSDTVQ